MIADRDPGDESDFEPMALGEFLEALEALDPCSMGVAPMDFGDDEDDA
jgi:hypothetical protein